MDVHWVKDLKLAMAISRPEPESAAHRGKGGNENFSKFESVSYFSLFFLHLSIFICVRLCSSGNRALVRVCFYLFLFLVSPTNQSGMLSECKFCSSILRENTKTPLQIQLS